MKKSLFSMVVCMLFCIPGFVSADDGVLSLLQGTWYYYGKGTADVIIFNDKMFVIGNTSGKQETYIGSEFLPTKIVGISYPSYDYAELPLIIIDDKNIKIQGISYHKEGTKAEENRLLSIANNRDPETLNSMENAKKLIGYWKSVMGTNKVFVFFDDSFLYINGSVDNLTLYNDVLYGSRTITSKKPVVSFPIEYFNAATIKISGETFTKEFGPENDVEYEKWWKISHPSTGRGPTIIRIE
jgi:hypothetical protein